SIPGEHLLPALLAIFRKNHPHVQVRVTITDSLAVLQLVEQGKVNLGLTGRRIDSPHLEFHPFARDEMVLVVPRGHAWARRNEIPLTLLAEKPLIVREAGSGSRWCLEQALGQAGMSLKDLSIALELGSNEAIKEAVREGLGLAVLSRHAVGKEKQSAQFRVL